MIALIWAITMAIFNKFTVNSIILGIISLLQWISIVILIVICSFNYTKYDYDDIKNNIQNLIMFNPIEDYLILGLPTISISWFFVDVYKNNSLNQFIVIIAIYTLLLLIYVMFIYYIQIRMSKKCTHLKKFINVMMI
ncbi:MAG: hypothetical protein ACOWWH_07460 [Eubacteriaceae bacterium]